MGKPSDKFKVSRRRKHKFRMRGHAQRVFPDWAHAWSAGDHLKVCSCWMCGNPRRHMKGKERLPFAERRAHLYWDD
ncbi:MAG: hypothetical protein KF760_26090 [Candidatus Eremiobacteraeota bacterium]|nr:hypothetical protein [Candidatus Eremiobacteraeota bacterium]MCW5869673.1 hypothetical protein [Candidatus Eremiobacteraeota bacterium]